MRQRTVEREPHPQHPRLYVIRRTASKFWYAETFIDGRKRRTSLKTATLSTALKLAAEWYRRVLKASAAEKREHPINKLGHDPTMGELAASYCGTLAPSKKQYALMKWGPVAEYWRAIRVTDVDPQTFRDFYKWRRRQRTRQRTPIRWHSIHKDRMVIRQILKYAVEEGHIAQLPIIPKIEKITPNPRPWFSRAEWDRLIVTAIERTGAAENARVAQQRLDLEDFINCLLESTMRVSELRELTVGQVQIVRPKQDGADPYAVIQVRGKTGHRTVIAGGVFPDVYVRRTEGLKAGDRIWPHSQRDAFRELLTATGLRVDEFGNARSLKSVRATAISFRILSQSPRPDLLTIARNAGTSVAMIDQFYARRLSAELNAGQLAKSVLEQ